MYNKCNTTKEFKMGRPKLALNLRCVSTSIRLRPDRLAKYKELGGVSWLNSVIDAKVLRRELGETK
jgi:hypothetical protein